MVAVTYGHHFLDECNDTSAWGSAHNSTDPLGSVTLTVQNGDYMRITGTLDNVADEYVYYEIDLTNISSDTITDFVCRYRTEDSSGTLGARVELVFTSGTQELLGANPAFSTSWTVASGAITAGKTIDKVRFYADDYPNSANTGTHWVEYDFLLLCKNTFTFPQAGTQVQFGFSPRIPILEIPGASGDITQNLGTRLATVSLRGSDMELHSSSWKRTGDVVEGEVLVDIWHNMKSEPWQWLTAFLSGSKGGMKATLDGEPKLVYDRGSGFDVVFKEKRVASADGETYAERLGLNL